MTSKKTEGSTEGLPDGYTIEWCSERGYDSPDRWVVVRCKGWKKEFGTSRYDVRQAKQACHDHAAKKAETLSQRLRKGKNMAYGICPECSPCPGGVSQPVFVGLRGGELQCWRCASPVEEDSVTWSNPERGKALKTLDLTLEEFKAMKRDREAMQALRKYGFSIQRCEDQPPLGERYQYFALKLPEENWSQVIARGNDLTEALLSAAEKMEARNAKKG